jgi:cobalamin biosynthesis protein CobT
MSTTLILDATTEDYHEQASSDEETETEYDTVYDDDGEEDEDEDAGEAVEVDEDAATTSDEDDEDDSDKAMGNSSSDDSEATEDLREPHQSENHGLHSVVIGTWDDTVDQQVSPSEQLFVTALHRSHETVTALDNMAYNGLFKNYLNTIEEVVFQDGNELISLLLLDQLTQIKQVRIEYKAFQAYADEHKQNLLQAMCVQAPAFVRRIQVLILTASPDHKTEAMRLELLPEIIPALTSLARLKLNFADEFKFNSPVNEHYKKLNYN